MREVGALSQLSLEPVESDVAAAAVDTIDIWFGVISLVEEARTGIGADLNASLLLSRPASGNTLFGTIPPTEMRLAPALSSSQPLAQLRGRLILKLEQLKSRLYGAFPETEATSLFASLVYYVDELVLRDPGARSWALLQAELFETSDGGERFFDLIDQRLAMAQTSAVVFEVFYYLLADHGKQKGFQGRYANTGDQIAQYQRRLQERINAPEPAVRKPAQRKNRQRAKLSRALVHRPLAGPLYYALALSGLLLSTLLIAWLSDLPDLAASRAGRSEPSPQEEAPE